MVATVTSNRIPNFPTPPSPKPSRITTMPSDLIVDKKRSYYTEIFFQDFRTAKYGAGSTAASALNTAFSSGATTGSVIGGITGAIGGAAAGFLRGGGLGAVAGAAVGGGLGAVVGSSITTSGGAVSASAFRLPIPNKINDVLVLNWQQRSAADILSSIPALSATINAVNTAGAFAGKAINPLLFLAFNHQNFREFTFDWVLAPKNRAESEAVKTIVSSFKNASLPTKAVIMDYPLIATVIMSPNNLNGHAIFKPMAVVSVAANYTANPTPSFFENTGAPTIVHLSVTFKEIELWYRNEVGV